MAREALYDGIADWYEYEFHAEQRLTDPLGIFRMLRELLGEGGGTCLEVGCGTGTYAGPVRELGRIPVGVDLSGGMLRHAVNRLPVARTDATTLPVRSASVDAVIAVMVHTDMPDYPRVLREIRRVLKPDGVFVHIGVHPAFCGSFADWTDREAIVISPGYLVPDYSYRAWTSAGLRAKVGAQHWPLPDLLHAFLDAGFILDRFDEGGEPTPTTLSIRAYPRSIP